MRSRSPCSQPPGSLSSFGEPVILVGDLEAGTSGEVGLLPNDCAMSITVGREPVEGTRESRVGLGGVFTSGFVTNGGVKGGEGGDTTFGTFARPGRARLLAVLLAHVRTSFDWTEELSTPGTLRSGLTPIGAWFPHASCRRRIFSPRACAEFGSEVGSDGLAAFACTALIGIGAATGICSCGTVIEDLSGAEAGEGATDEVIFTDCVSTVFIECVVVPALAATLLVPLRGALARSFVGCKYIGTNRF